MDQKIFKRLAENLKEAEAERDRIRAVFDEATSGRPRSMPYPESVGHIKQTSKEYQSAMKAVEAARKAQLDFVLHGILPGDEKSQDGRNDGGSD